VGSKYYCPFGKTDCKHIRYDLFTNEHTCKLYRPAQPAISSEKKNFPQTKLEVCPWPSKQEPWPDPTKEG